MNRLKKTLSAKEWMIKEYPENAEFYRNGGASSIFKDMEGYATYKLQSLTEKGEKFFDECWHMNKDEFLNLITSLNE